MDANRLTRIIRAIGGSGDLDPESYMERVCSAGVELLNMSGTGLTLMTRNAELGAVSASDKGAQVIEDLQFTLGEGPALDAFRLGTPALEPNMADAPVRWPFFGPAALELGVLAVFSFPLQMGVIRLGCFDLFRDRPGFLTEDELADALLLADLVTEDIVDLQAEGGLRSTAADHLGRRARVYEATGMVAAQIDSDMASALARLRAHAFASEISIFEVAEQVIARSLRLSATS